LYVGPQANKGVRCALCFLWLVPRDVLVLSPVVGGAAGARRRSAFCPRQGRGCPGVRGRPRREKAAEQKASRGKCPRAVRSGLAARCRVRLAAVLPVQRVTPIMTGSLTSVIPNTRATP